MQQHLLGVLDQLALPGQSSPLQAWVQPPALEATDSAKAYIWGGSGRETRQTMPRGMGFKTIAWNVDVYLFLQTVSDLEAVTWDVSQEFPLVIDAVMKACRTADMPIAVTDPTTGDGSQLLAVGESMTLEYPPERAAASQRLVFYTARIGVDMMEAIQG